MFDHTGIVCAGISVAGPATRVTSERTLELGRLVQAAAFSISRRIGHDSDSAEIGASGAG